MSIFVPNGNSPIKPEETKEPDQTPMIEQTIPTSSGLNHFPGWKRADDEFVVDL